MIVSACVSERRDWFWLSKRAARFDCEVSQDRETAIIGVMGPKSTRLLRAICDDPDQAEQIDYYTSTLLTARDITFRANRFSYVGERGFELYLPAHEAKEHWQRLLGAGAPLNIRAAGFHAMNACRMEKGYRHWGDDIHVTSRHCKRALASPPRKTRQTTSANRSSMLSAGCRRAA